MKTFRFKTTILLACPVYLVHLCFTTTILFSTVRKMAKDAAIKETKEASSLGPEVSEKNQQPLAPSELSGSEESGYNRDTNPFVVPETAEHWREVYEKSQYECRHVYDPTLSWTEAEEKKVIRKLDWRICLWAVSDFRFSAPGHD